MILLTEQVGLGYGGSIDDCFLEFSALEFFRLVVVLGGGIEALTHLKGTSIEIRKRLCVYIVKSV